MSAWLTRPGFCLYYCKVAFTCSGGPTINGESYIMCLCQFGFNFSLWYFIDLYWGNGFLSPSGDIIPSQYHRIGLQMFGYEYSHCFCYYLRRGGYALGAVCLLVCLSVNRTMQKVRAGFPRVSLLQTLQDVAFGLAEALLFFLFNFCIRHK